MPHLLQMKKAIHTYNDSENEKMGLTLCFSPPDSLSPLSPTTVSYL